VKIKDTLTCGLALDFLWLTASFGAVTTDLIILSYAVLHRTLGKLVLKNVNQVCFCTMREHKYDRKGDECSISSYIVLINDCYVTLSPTCILRCASLPGGYNLFGNGRQIFSSGFF
jgi:hypothetical protein